MYVGPKLHSSEFTWPLSFDDKVKIYDARVRGWFLDIAESLSGQAGTDFVVLMVITSFFEGHEIYWQGNINSTREFFKQAFVRMVASAGLMDSQKAEEVSEKIYTHVRCGLFHIGMLRAETGLYRGEKGHPADPIQFEELDGKEYILFNAPKLLQSLKRYFDDYIARLRNPTETKLRENFERAWDALHPTSVEE